MEAEKINDLKRLLGVILNKHVDSIFELAHDYANTESGDITPEQSGRLEELKEQLLGLVMEQTIQNLPEPLPKSDKLYEYSVTVCRTASACREILVMAHSEEEARAIAEEEAGDHEYSEKEADYTIEDVTKMDTDIN